MQQYGQITRAASQYEAAVPAGAAQPLQLKHAMRRLQFQNNDAVVFTK